MRKFVFYLRQRSARPWFGLLRPFLLVFCLIWVYGLWPAGRAAAAQTPPADSVAPNATLTLGPRAGTRVVLDVLQLDVTVQEDGERTAAGIETSFRFQNPLTRTITLDAGLQSGDTTPPVEHVNLTVGGVTQELQDEAQVNSWSWRTSLDPQARLEANLSYRVALGSGPLARFRYEPVRSWAGGPGSARLSIHFAGGLIADQLISVQPDGYRLSASQLEWSYDNRGAIAPLDVLFITSAAWQALDQARAAVAAPDAPAAAHLALGRWYQRLATVETGGDGSLLQRYYPQALAELIEAQRLAPQDTAAYRLLADLYRRLARGAAQGQYLALAAEQLAGARQAGDNSPELAAELAQLYFDLASRAQEQHQWQVTAHYLDLLAQDPAAATQSLSQARLQAMQQTVALARAMEQVARGDLNTARRSLDAVWGEETLLVPGAAMANFTPQIAEVYLGAGVQVITMTLPARADRQVIGLAALQSVAAAARAVAGVDALLDESGDAPRLLIRIPYLDMRDLRLRRADLTASLDRALDADAGGQDLALLRVLLSPQETGLVETAEPFWLTRRFSETLDLPLAYRYWMEQAARYDRAVTALAAGASAVGDLDLAPVRRAVWQEEAAAWRALAAASEVRYRVALTATVGLDRSQSWISRLDEPLQVGLSVRDYRLEALAAAGAGLLLLALITAWLFWRLS